MTNYFELYGLPVSMRPDKAAVKSKFYELSRRYHPDRFASTGADEMAENLRMAAVNNDAYRTLTDPDKTMAYVLTLAGMLEDEEKYTLPPDFLMEMMDLNEAVSDFEDMPDNEQARLTAMNSLAEQMQAWESHATTLTDRFEAGDKDEQLLKQIKDMYFRKKYLLRIQQRIDTFAAH